MPYLLNNQGRDMKVFEIGGKLYGVVITQDDAGAEIGLWCGDEQLASTVVDEEGAKAHEKAR